MFIQFFEERCYGKQSCSLESNNMGYYLDQVVDNERKTLQETGLFGLFSDNCKHRMSDEAYGNITSKQYIGIFGCKYDTVSIPFSE
jgi:hypothetical protein